MSTTCRTRPPGMRPVSGITRDGSRTAAPGASRSIDRRRTVRERPLSRSPRSSGMEDLRLALLLNAVSPAIGGVLVRGEKGTAKSTVVRALAGAAAAVDVVAGCRFACDPAAPDPACPDGPHDAATRAPAPGRRGWSSCRSAPPRTGVVGALDLERALAEGVKAFEPGLLAAAHRGRAVRRRGQPAARPPGRPAAGRRRDGRAPTSSARASPCGTRRGSCSSAR